MKIKIIALILFIFSIVKSNAQSLNNCYADAQSIVNNFGGQTAFNKDDTATLRIIREYIPAENQTDYNAIVAYLKTNPFFLAVIKRAVNPDASQNVEAKNVSEIRLQIEQLLGTPVDNTVTPSSQSFSQNLAYGLTDLIIERAKEELSAVFFQNLKKELGNNQALYTAFPQTAKFIRQIQPYLFATYLSALREAFFADINNLPYDIGAVLRTSEIKAFIAKYPESKQVWKVVPILQFIGDLHNGKSIADAIKSLYPDKELYDLSPLYYSILKLTAVLSESVRDPTGKQNWISTGDFNALITDDTKRNVFLGLLYESTKSVVKLPDGTAKIVNEYICSENLELIKKILSGFTTDYNGANDLFLAYKSIADAVKAGNTVTLIQITTLINSAQTTLKGTLDDIKRLDPNAASVTVKTDVYFADISQIVDIATDFDKKNYASGVMKTMLLMNQYLGANPESSQPFKTQEEFIALAANNANVGRAIQNAINNLGSYQVNNPGDNINSLVKKLTMDQKALSAAPTPAQIIQINKDLQKIRNYVAKDKSTGNDGNASYQKILKYATLMATMAEAKTPADVQAALDAAILPVGSSSIKYYTVFDIALNSYIGLAYYKPNYNMVGSSTNMNFSTLGVALPIGLNFSWSTRWKEVGAISAYFSVVDLGAVASYRLNNPSSGTTTTQTLPAFTLQNLLAPGGFLVLNRILNTHCARVWSAESTAIEQYYERNHEHNVES